MDDKFYHITYNDDIYTIYQEKIIHFNIDKLNIVINNDFNKNLIAIFRLYKLKNLHNILIYSLLYNISKTLIFINYHITKLEDLNQYNLIYKTSSNSIYSKSYKNYDEFFTTMFNIILSTENDHNVIYDTFRIKSSLKCISHFFNSYHNNFSHHIFYIKDIIFFIYYYFMQSCILVTLFYTPKLFL